MSFVLPRVFGTGAGLREIRVTAINHLISIPVRNLIGEVAVKVGPFGCVMAGLTLDCPFLRIAIGMEFFAGRHGWAEAHFLLG